MTLCSTDLSGFLCTPHLKDGGSKSLGDKVGELLWSSSQPGAHPLDGRTKIDKILNQME